MNTFSNKNIHQPTKITQLILLDKEGYVVKSCESLFGSDVFQQKPVQEAIPFIESIFPSLQQLNINSPEIRFTKVEMPASFLPGYYDFTFSYAQLEDATGILWCIFDYTDVYIDLMKYQQRKNELEIHRQHFELQNQQLKHSSEIFLRKNYFYPYLSGHRSKSFSHQVRDVVLSNENILDTLGLLTGNEKASLFDNLCVVNKALINLKESFESINQDKSPGVFQESTFTIKNILGDVQKTLEAYLQTPLPLDFIIDDNVPTALVGKAKMIQLVLFHLLLNSFQQSPAKKIYIHTSFSTQNASNVILQFIFNEQADDPLSEEIKNPADLILRLSLVKKLLELDGGKIIPLYELSNPIIRLNIQVNCQLP